MCEVSRKREDWIDVWKGIGIFLVVLGHTFISFRDNIFIFHMPMFFFISGYLYTRKEESGFKYIIHRAKALLYPYAFFMIIGLCANILVRGYYIKADVFIMEFLTAKRGSGLVNPTLWFLPVLFIVEVISNNILIYLKKWEIIPTLFLFFLGSYLVDNGIQMIWSLEYAFIYLMFYYLGRGAYIIHKNGIKTTFRLKIIFIERGGENAFL